ncbi:hypothetical protein JFT91_08170 [Pseudomonas sp. TH08]|uniref:hypothetical protein n=1 Tax=unclassified Pseudomonas TaxID=196821 RepID=UPI001912387F|nr:MULTISPECIES: hypothetical protein [unclassified Pseudomonas]MBK5526151.1 hypothetical protein [Pseudomonas sp. TH06]MBK5532584.1 hypothetical protein [Pseudomonas sp. TH08]
MENSKFKNEILSLMKAATSDQNAANKSWEGTLNFDFNESSEEDDDEDTDQEYRIVKVSVKAGGTDTTELSLEGLISSIESKINALSEPPYSWLVIAESDRTTMRCTVTVLDENLPADKYSQ